MICCMFIVVLPSMASPGRCLREKLRENAGRGARPLRNPSHLRTERRTWYSGVPAREPLDQAMFQTAEAAEPEQAVADVARSDAQESGRREVPAIPVRPSG